ncbi:MAG: hypothetical protein WCQ76_05995 [Fusobacterium sp.]
MITKEIEYALYSNFMLKSKLITTGVTMGKLFNHECDVIVVTKNDYLLEYEIKISKSDLLADFKKKHNHEGGNKIKSTTFVIPYDMKDCVDLIPLYFGVMTVKKGEFRETWGRKTPLIRTQYICQLIRKPQINKKCKKLTTEEYIDLCRLASMRGFAEKRQNLINKGVFKWEKE